MNRIISYTLILWFSGMMTVLAQNTAFDSFISRMAQQYKVDIALSPELVPSVDSIMNSGTTINSVEELLRLLVKQEHLTYQIVDGNKLMLRRDTDPVITASALTIEGNILDQKDGQPLSYAVVRIINSTRGCQSDEQGHFQMPVSDTTSMLEVDYLGYTPVKIPARRFMEGPVTVRMKMQEVPLEEVTIVVPYKEIARDPGTQSLNLSGYQLISGDQLLQWNIDRLINTLTGYTQFSSDEGIRIRGVEPENSLFLMDGLPVYSPYHFYNIFSPFNGQYFSSVKIYKNNLPVAYGGRVDGMIQLESDTKSPKDHLVLESDLLLSSLAAQVNIAKNFTASVAGRISHTKILNEALTDSSVINFKVPGKFKDNNEWTSVNEPRSNFYDLNAGISGQINPGVKTYINFFTSRDTLRNTTNSSFEASSFNHEIEAVEQTLITRDEWKNLGASAGMEMQLGSQAALLVDAFTSKYEKESYYKSNFDKQEHGSHHRMENTGFQYDRLNNSGLRSYVEKSIFGGSGYQLGIDLNRYKVNLNATENESPYVSQVQHEFETTLFGSYQTHVFSHFLITAGARVTHLDRTSKLYLLPNLKANYYIGSFFHIRAAYSKNLQALHDLNVENRFGREIESLVLSDPGSGYPVLKSDKYMFGAGYVRTHVSLDAEVYFKKLDGLIRIAALRPDPGFNDHDPPTAYYHLFSGQGWTAGLDITAVYKIKKTDIVLSYTLSKIQEKYDQLFHGDYFSPQEDRRHQLKLSGNYQLGPVMLGGLVTYKSKAPYVSFVQVEEHGGGGIDMTDPQSALQYLPEYFSLDFSADYAFDFFKTKTQVGVSLINATDHANIQEIQHTGRVSRDNMGGLYITQQTELLGRTWNAHVRLVF